MKIAPINTIIFGWQMSASGWKPTTHTLSPLVKASPPNTVKQLRSWLGSFKQLTDCIENYAVILGPLEDVVAGRASADCVTWSEGLLETFKKAQQALNKVETI